MLLNTTPSSPRGAAASCNPSVTLAVADIAASNTVVSKSVEKGVATQQFASEPANWGLANESAKNVGGRPIMEKVQFTLVVRAASIISAIV